MKARLEQIARELHANVTPGRADKERAYLKSDLAHIGVRVPTIRKIARRAAKGLSRDHAVALADALWAEPIHEMRTAAVEVLDLHAKQLKATDMPRLERMLREARTWALVDPLSISVVGGLVEREPGLTGVLDRWIEDEDFWLRRAALLALLRPLRRGEGDWERFVRYADATLEEKEFFIRKAIGWILREAGKKRPERVHAFVAPRTHRASGVTMREAVKALDAEQADALMTAYRNRTPSA